jgi:hypothetical protein
LITCSRQFPRQRFEAANPPENFGWFCKGQGRNERNITFAQAFAIRQLKIEGFVEVGVRLLFLFQNIEN